MTNGIPRRMAAHFIFIATSLIVLAAPALSQQPTTAQRNAIREACRSDYEAHCASVPTGGKPALTCLQNNMTSLSAPCQKAVNAIGKSSAAPAAAPAAAAPAQAATSATPAPQPAPPAAKAAVANPKSATVGAVAMAPPPRAISPRQEVALVRTSCGSDFRAYCGNVRLGGGRAVACLRAKQASLSATCQGALSGLSQAR